MTPQPMSLSLEFSTSPGHDNDRELLLISDLRIKGLSIVGVTFVSPISAVEL